jgi:hypothetical protein
MAAGHCPAAICHGVSFPDSVRLQDVPLELNGLGVRKATFLRISVYVAALYAPRSAAPGGRWPIRDGRTLIDRGGPQELVLHFVRGVGVGDIRRAFEEGFEAVARGSARGSLAERIRTLEGWLEDMRDGESMRFLRIPGRGIELEIGGRGKGVIPGEDFAAALFSIWLGDHPPNPELKAGLLGGDCR